MKHVEMHLNFAVPHATAINWLEDLISTFLKRYDSGLEHYHYRWDVLEDDGEETEEHENDPEVLDVPMEIVGEAFKTIASLVIAGQWLEDHWVSLGDKHDLNLWIQDGDAKATIYGVNDGHTDTTGPVLSLLSLPLIPQTEEK